MFSSSYFNFAAGYTGGDLIERAVATEADHNLDTATSSVLRKSRGVAAPIGLDYLDLICRSATVALHQRAVHHNGVTRRHRGRKSVDHEQNPQGIDSTAPCDRLGQCPTYR